MALYSNTYLKNIKTCLNKAIAVKAVKNSVSAGYLTENCQDCNNPIPPCCNMQSWLSVVTAWDNSDNAVNGITESQFKEIIENINASLGCTQPPNILTVSLSPVGITIDPGDDVTLTGAATGGLPPYTYQWRKNGVVLTGETIATLALINITGTQAGTYTLDITDVQNSTVTTSSAIITVTSVALSATNPSPATIEVGGNATFSTVANGGVPPYMYQWKKGTSNISGATLANYIINNATLNDAGTYRCVITDSGASTITTDSAALTINTSQVTITYGYSDTDVFTNVEVAPSVPNPISANITHNADLYLTLPSAAIGKFIVVKVPQDESLKHNYEEVGAFNSGPIPDSVWRDSFTVAGFTYYTVRNEAGFAFDSAHQIRLY